MERLALALLCVLSLARAHPGYLDCGRVVAVGSRIMGKVAVSDTIHPVEVSRNGLPLVSGAEYVPGETLSVRFAFSSAIKYALSSDGGVFGSVSGTRVCDTRVVPSATGATVTLTMPGCGPVSVWAAYAPSETAVKVSAAFALAAPLGATCAPSAAPVVSASSLQSSGKSCRLSDKMTLYWSQDAGALTVMSVLKNPAEFSSFGIVASYLSMVPSATKHSVFLFAPNLPSVFRFVLGGYEASDFTVDSSSSARVTQTTVSSDSSSMVVQFDADYPHLDSTSTLIWAHGGVWPVPHSDSSRGFVAVDWGRGSCAVPTPISPFFVFLPLALVVLVQRTPLGHLAPVSYLATTKLWLPADMSLGGLLLLLVHLALCLAVLLTSAFTFDSYSFLRALGDVALMNFWIALLPSSRSWAMQLLTKVPFERAIRYHQIVAPLAVVLALTHGLMNAVLNTDIYFSAVTVGDKAVVPVYGACALFVFFAMAVFAVEPIRRANYELFLLAHHLYPAGVVLVVLHVPFSLWGFLPGIVLHAIDAGVRLYAWLVSVSAEDVFSAGRVTCIEVRTDGRGGAGEYYYLNVGAVASLEWHPISVAFRDRSKTYFYVQAQGPGSWSERLNALAARAPGRMQVALEGPYGQLSVELERYETVVLIAGGIGVTPFLNLIKRVAVDRKYAGVRSVVLHWCVRGRALYALLEDKLDTLLVDREELLTEADPLNQAKVKLLLYDTDRESEEAGGRGKESVQQLRGRCEVDKVVGALRDQGSRACVLVCGPASLTDAVSAAARTNGVHCHTEKFMY